MSQAQTPPSTTASTESSVSALDAEALSRAESEGMIANRAPAPPKRPLAALWLSRARSRWTSMFRALRGRPEASPKDATPAKG